MARAFIDNGKIKIISDEGHDYQNILDSLKNKVKFLTLIRNSFTCITIIFGILTLSPVFYEFITSAQNIFFGIGTFISLVTALGVSEAIEQPRENYSSTFAEFNLAKETLQGDIFELEKVLLSHQMSMDEIKNTSKFAFKKQDEMVV